MDITPLVPKGRKIITGYGGGGFKINHEMMEGSLLIFSGEVMPWTVSELSAITMESLMPIVSADPAVELLLIGTGKTMGMIDPAIRQAFKDRHIAVDVMDTGAACRTYNVLLAEERRVAAALVAI